jgi:hypothetical protein
MHLRAGSHFRGGTTHVLCGLPGRTEDRFEAGEARFMDGLVEVAACAGGAHLVSDRSQNFASSLRGEALRFGLP